MTKKISLKLVSIIAAISIILSVMIPLGGIFAFAEEPTVPENAVVVLDEEGKSNTVGDYFVWLWDRLFKENTASFDFSVASNVDFDVKFSDYEAIKAYTENNGNPLTFNLASGANKWANRGVSPNIFNFETGTSGDWHHFSIPVAYFGQGDASIIDWTQVKHWMFGFNNPAFANDSTGELASVSVTVKNICGTVKSSDLPSESAVMLDEDGVSKTLGDNGDWRANWFEGRFVKIVNATDLSDADFIEFDIKYSNYENFKNYIETNNYSFGLHLTSSGQAWADRSAVDIMIYGVDMGDGLYHYTIPKSAFTVRQNGGVDWSAVNFWMLFGENADVRFGDIYSDTLTISNIRGTVDIPEMPENVVTVIDIAGASNTIGTQFVQLCDRIVKRVNPSVDVSQADYIEFDMKYQDYVALNRKAGELGIFITFNLASNENIWYNRERTNDINAYATKGENDWYHFKIPIADFVNVNMGEIDLTNIMNWFIGFEGANLYADTGEFANYVLNVKNVCATSKGENDIFRPALISEALYVIDQLGISSTIGTSAEDTYSQLSEIFTNTGIISGDLTVSKKVFMNVYVDDVDALPDDLSISFGVKDGEGYRYCEAVNIKNQIVKDGWNEVFILVKDIKFQNAEDLKNIAVWKLTTTNTSAVGDNADCRLWVCNIAGTVDATAPDMPENAAVIIDEPGMENTIGTQFVHSFDRLVKKIEPADVSNAGYIEFDAHFDDFMKLARTLNELDLTMSFHLTSSGQQWTDRYFVGDILHYAIEGENNWWHFKIPLEDFNTANVGHIDWEAINLWMIGFDGTNMYAETGELANSAIKIMNICATSLEDNPMIRPNYASDAVSLIDQMGVLSTFGSNENDTYDKISDRFASDTIVEGDLTAGKYISLQVYVDDPNALPDNLGLVFGVKDGDGIRYLNKIEIAGQIEKSGWNEVIIPSGSVTSENPEDLKNVVCWRLYSSDTSKVGKYANSRLWVCNIIGIVESTAPELPKNIIATINYRGLTNTPGSAFSWLADRMFQQDLGPFDISVADYLEFDFYVEDYKAVKDAMEANDMDIIIGISSGDPEQYETSRYFSRIISYFYDQVKQDGWNHIKIPMTDFISAGEGDPYDSTAVTSFMLSFLGDNIQGDSSAIADVTLKIINVCATTERPYIEIPKDSSKPSMPDKNAVYINTAEALFDENGTWNPAAVTVDTDYKTEGEASISNILFDQTLRTNQLRYIFNETADISDVKTFKFDFFVSDIELLTQRAEMSFVISSDVRGVGDYYSWKLNLGSLKNGWNSIEISFDSSHITEGSPDLTQIKSVIIQCDKASFQSEKYTERVTVKVDNLRYISKTGNTTLNINYGDDPFGDDYDFGDDWDDFYDEEVIPGETVENVPGEAPVITDTQVVKKTVNNVVMQYLWLIIALAAELVAVAGIITAVYFIRKKKRVK